MPASTTLSPWPRTPRSAPPTIACSVSTAAATYTAGYARADIRAGPASEDAATSSHSSAHESAIAAATRGSASTTATVRRVREPLEEESRPAITSRANDHQAASATLGDGGTPEIVYTSHAI